MAVRLAVIVCAVVGMACGNSDGGNGSGGGSSQAGGGAANGGGGGFQGAGGGTTSTGGGGGKATGGGTAQGSGGGTASGGGAGGGTGIHREELTAGTRLKVRSIVGTDGSRFQQNFYDSVLGVVCYFGPASDGTFRCIPQAVVSGGQYYSDSSCTLNVFTAHCSYTALFGPLVYGSIYNTQTCNGPYDYYKLGGAYSGNLFTKNATSCVAAGTTSDSTRSSTLFFVAAGGVVPPSSFVQGSYVIE